MAKYVLDMSAVQSEFFGGSALIGIISGAPAYRLCWLFNQHFGTNFVREPELDLMVEKKGIKYYFPLYQHAVPNTEYRYLFYKLKNGKELLVPDLAQYDYVWLLQTDDHEEEARLISGQLRNFGDIQLARIVDAKQLRNILNLLI